MKTSDLLKFTRIALKDTVKPYLWSDEELVGHLAEAEEKACRNGRLITDNSTPELCKYTVSITRQYVVLDPRVIYVRRVSLASRSTPLRRINFRDLDLEQPGWIDRTGTPDRWCPDFESGRIWFNRKATVADTARLLVVRVPLTPLSVSEPDREPENAAPYHRPLHHWACNRAHSKPDSQGQDDKKAAFHYNAFIAEFGDDSSALEQQWAREHYGEDDTGGER